MQKITIDTRILVNGKMYTNSTEGAYIDMNNKIPSSYKGEKDRVVKYLLAKTNTKIENALANLTYTEGGAAPKDEAEKK